MELEVERRQTTRLDCCYPVLGSAEEVEFNATVINMGLMGLRFLAPRRLEADVVVALTASGIAMSEAFVRVVWARQHGSSAEFEAGAVYLGPVATLDRSWVKFALQKLGFEGAALYERRHHVRRVVDVGAAVFLQGEGEVSPPPGRREYSSRVLDFGLGGALIQTEHPLPGVRQGMLLQLEISLPGLAIPMERLAARVVYMRNPQEIEGEETSRRYGLRFEEDGLTRAKARLVEGFLEALS